MKSPHSLLVAGLMLAAALAVPAQAMEADPTGSNFVKCLDWCYKHNKHEPAISQCEGRCALYWWPGKTLPKAVRD